MVKKSLTANYRHGHEGILGTAASVEGTAELILVLKDSQGVKCVMCLEAGSASPAGSSGRAKGGPTTLEQTPSGLLSRI